VQIVIKALNFLLQSIYIPQSLFSGVEPSWGNHLDQNINLNEQKINLLVNANTAECNVSQHKNNYHETSHNGATGIERTI